MTRKVALIGFGAIAQAICRALENDTEVSVSQVFVRREKRGEMRASLPPNISPIVSVEELKDDIDFVLECAGHGAVSRFGSEILERGVDFGIASVGALADDNLLNRLQTACRSGSARCLILPGAIGGIDAVAAAGQALETVTYTARKPPLSWLGSPAEETHDLREIDKPTVLFTGTARDAALKFPKNANVVATTALAGIGLDKTEVTLMADPGALGNSHHIHATGPQFDLDFATVGAALPDNPRTSALTAFSATRALKHRGTGLLI